MSGGFRDSFTKEDTKEDLLGYDDTAFYYFAISALTTVALPWTFSLVMSLFNPARLDKDFPVKNTAGETLRYCKTSAMVSKVEYAKAEAKRFSPSTHWFWIVKMMLLLMIWCGIVGTGVQLGQETEIKRFDPFDILGVTPQASVPEIKRAYRKLSLVFHPDKNPDDPLAASRFIQIRNAYSALTDETAKRNWEKYGNPDGPQTTKVGIGLPKFLLEKDNSLYILVTFFFVLLFVVPMTFICYYQRTKNYAANGVRLETLQFLGCCITETTKLKNGPELLAACAESRCMLMRPSDNADIKALGSAVVEHKKRTYSVPTVMKNQYILWAHLQRVHNLMSEELKRDCDELLCHSPKITQAMIEIACMREWFSIAQAMIEFRRCLIQALDVKASQLLQAPHFNDEVVEHCRTAKNVVTLMEFLELDASERKTLLVSKLEPHQMVDVDAFISHIGVVEIKAFVEVEDETEMVVGDVATLVVEMKRKNLKRGEASGPVHAPLFPETKYEEWWLFLVEATPSTRIVHFERVRDTAHFVEERMRFQITHDGEHKLVLHAMCDSYAGIDHKVEINFSAYSEAECNREYKIHQEDEDIDLQPTVFQQFLGELHAEDDESEEEEEEEEDGGGKAKNRGKARSKATKASDGKSPERTSQAEDGSDEDEDGGSESSSDSE